jgi:hypothetical protein
MEQGLNRGRPFAVVSLHCSFAGRPCTNPGRDAQPIGFDVKWFTSRTFHQLVTPLSLAVHTLSYIISFVAQTILIAYLLTDCKEH